MRAVLALLACVVLLAASAGGCGGGDNNTGDTGATSEPSRWSGPGQKLGSLDVAAFNSHAESVDEGWERSPLTVATEFVRVDEADAQITSAASRTAAEGGDRASAVVTLDDLRDDSIQARRYTMALTRRTDGTWKLDTVTADQRCRPGRGPQVYSTTKCT
jgi:hypothetical protein